MINFIEIDHQAIRNLTYFESRSNSLNSYISRAHEFQIIASLKSVLLLYTREPGGKWMKALTNASLLPSALIFFLLRPIGERESAQFKLRHVFNLFPSTSSVPFGARVLIAVKWIDCVAFFLVNWRWCVLFLPSPLNFFRPKTHLNFSSPIATVTSINQQVILSITDASLEKKKEIASRSSADSR